MAKTIRVTLRYIEILDSKDLDGQGEFVFEFKGSVPERGEEQTLRIPKSGHLSISDHPSMRKVTLNKVFFEGEVEDGETLVLEATGEEIDRMSANDMLQSYRREFTGEVASWIKEYSPWDEGTGDASDPEQLGDWRIAYGIEEV
jgi:hypothetical protein